MGIKAKKPKALKSIRRTRVFSFYY